MVVVVGNLWEMLGRLEIHPFTCMKLLASLSVASLELVSSKHFDSAKLASCSANQIMNDEVSSDTEAGG